MRRRLSVTDVLKLKDDMLAYEEYDSEEDEEETLEVVSNRPLTKRQRAKLNNDTTEEYLELPMGTSTM